MPKIKTIEIDEAKCNGCGRCVVACHEGVIALREGKARVIKEATCDGLGSCIPACPEGAIRSVEKEVETTCPSPGAQNLNWPIKLKLVSPLHHFSSQDLVLAADCSAFVSRDFSELLEGRRVLASCPKFDQDEHSLQALQMVLTNQTFRSLAVWACGLSLRGSSGKRQPPSPSLIRPGEQKAIPQVDAL